MEFFGIKKKATVRPRRIHKYASNLGENEQFLYNDPITVYDTPPQISVSVSEFEKYAFARLRVLRLIEKINLADMDHKYSGKWKENIYNEVKKQEFTEFLVILGNEQDDMDSMKECRKFDHISHYLLRLAFSQTDEQRKWFIALEVDLFRVRLSGLSAMDLKNFLDKSNFPGELISEDEKNKRQTLIMNSIGGIANLSLIHGDMYKIPFIHTLDLVRNRKVFLLNGQAYVPYTEIISVITGAFRTHLSESMSYVKKNIHIVEQDQRIMNAIAEFDKRHTGNDYNKKNTSAAVTAEQLPVISQKSFPLCMKSLYDVVVKDHHLKHFGRLQLGLFLKAIGMPMEEATKFWRGHFTKKPEIDGTRFDKQYLYNIRHMYGQEGKRADYTPYSCIKVINSSVGPGDFHGCPFRHSDPSNLRVKLIEAEIPQNGVKEIMDLVDKHHYQIACQKYFEWTHGSMTIEGGVNHPNQYFEESKEVLSGKKTIKAEDKVKTTNVKIFSQSQILSQLDQEKPQDTPDQVEDMEIDDNDDEELLKMASQFDAK